MDHKDKDEALQKGAILTIAFDLEGNADITQTIKIVVTGLTINKLLEGLSKGGMATTIGYHSCEAHVIDLSTMIDGEFEVVAEIIDQTINHDFGYQNIRLVED